METTNTQVKRREVDMGKKGKGFGEMQFLQLPQAQVLSDLTKRNIPTAIEDEWGIFACIFNVTDQARQFNKAATILEAKHFYVEPLSDVWRAMIEAKRRRIPIEFKCILNYLQDWHNKNKDFLGAMISHLHESLHDPECIEDYARRIVQKYDGREVLKVCASGIHSLVGENPVSPGDALLDMERKLRELRQQVVLKQDQDCSFDALADNYIAKLKAIASGERKSDVITTENWYDFDQSCQGFVPGDFFVFGAPSGCGKSITGTSLAREFSTKGESVFYATLEMPCEQMFTRIVSPLVDSPVSKLSRSSQVTASRIEEIEAVREKLRGLKLAVKKPETNSYESFEKSLAEAEASFEKKFGEDFKGFRVIVVDYLQLLAANVAPQLTTIEIDRVAKKLRNLAIEKECTVIALAQMDTETAKGGKEPNSIGCLSYCKTIDHHATQVILMWNNCFGDRQKLKTSTYIDYIWVKNRDGANDRVRMGIDWSRNWLYSLANGSNRSYENDPASQARPIARVPDLKLEWKGFEKFKVEGSEDSEFEFDGSKYDNTDLHLAAPKGSDVEVDEEILKVVTGGKLESDPEPQEEPPVVVQAEIVESLPELPPAAEAEQEQSESVAEAAVEEDVETVAVDGITYRIGEIVDHVDTDLKGNPLVLKAKVLGKGWVIDDLDEGVTIEFLEGWKDWMYHINGNEWIIAPGQIRTTYTEFLSKLE